MLKRTLRSKCSHRHAFQQLLGHTPYASRPKYFQQRSRTQRFFNPNELETCLPVQQVAAAQREPTRVALREWEEEVTATAAAGLPSSHSLAHPMLPEADTSMALSTTSAFTTTDDLDVVVETPEELSAMNTSSASSGSASVASSSKSSSGIGVDVLELVTDEFRELREREIRRRREYLYHLTHPCLVDYTYAGKLVPPPPLTFGTISPESISLGRKLMLEQDYSLVHSAKSSDYFFEINDLYLEVVMVGKANAGKSSLINALLGQNVAKTSSTPNSTREVKFYQSVSPEELERFANRNPNKLVKLPGGGLQLTFVDLPGFGITGMSEKWRDNAIACTDGYLGVRRSVNTVLFCIDCERGLTKADITYMEWLENLHGVFWIILTKCDEVPHSRVCAVMRQLYSLITKYRRKYRKAFPFILPVSAKDGTNIDVLRGLITETSGIIPGDKLRDMLAKKAAVRVAESSANEAARLQEIWRQQREDARREYFQRRGLTNETMRRVEDEAAAASKAKLIEADHTHKSQSKSLRLSLKSADQQEGSSVHPRSPLAYSNLQVKLNHGLTGTDDGLDITWGGSPPAVNDHTAQAGGDPHQSASSTNTEMDIKPMEGVNQGPVSKYLSTLEQMQRREEKRNNNVVVKPQQGSGGHHRHHGTTRVLSELPDGRLAEFKAGVQSGKTKMVTHNGDATVEVTEDDRQAWRARRYARLAQRECPDAPWSALAKLKKRDASMREQAALKKMKKRDFEGWLKNAGGVISGFDRFENEVTATKYMNEHRRASTLRQKAQWEQNAVDKINYRSQPPGLLKAYGEQNSYWPTSSVLGVDS